MLSEGMLFALASAMIVRSRGLVSASPPPARAATVNSLISRVKILPRLASAAPFLCLMVCHLEWPDILRLLRNSCGINEIGLKILPHRTLVEPGRSPLSPRQDYPDVRSGIPGATAVVAQNSFDVEPGTCKSLSHLGNR